MYFPIPEILLLNPKHLTTDTVRNKKMSKEGHVKRPLNCFMLYSSRKRPEVQKVHPEKHHSEISSILGKHWKALSFSEQKKYHDESLELKKEHDIQFPSYKYKPIRKGRSSPRKVKCLSKRATNKSATCPKLVTGNIAHLSDSTASTSGQAASGNQNVMTGVQKQMPKLRRFISKKPLQRELLQCEPLEQELLQQERNESLQQELFQPKPLQQKLLQPVSLRQESTHWRIGQQEALQWEEFETQPSHWRSLHQEPLQREPLQRKPLQAHPLGPFLGELSTRPANNRLPFSCETDDEDAALMKIVNINDVLHVE